MLERYLCLGGVELANAARTLSYLANRPNPCLATIPDPDGCRCPEWDEGAVYSLPELDDAPWYDPRVPESADVLGVWIEDIAMSAGHQRSSTRGQHGSSLGAPRLGGREVMVVGWVYTASPAATAYARSWLYEALNGGSCAGCDLPDLEVMLHCGCPEGTATPGARTLRRVGLREWDPNLDPEFPKTCGFKFSALLEAESPELFGDPIPVADLGLWRPEGERVCNVCVPCPQDEQVVPCACGPELPPLRTVETPDEATLWCEPMWQARHSFSVPAPPWWRTGTLVVRVEGGAWPGQPSRPGVANLRLRAWPKPPGVEDPAELVCQEPCLSVEIGCVPAGGVLVLDGRARTAQVTCGGVTSSAWPVLSSGGGRFRWPHLECRELLVAVEADAYQTAPDARLAVELVYVDRA